MSSCAAPARGAGPAGGHPRGGRGACRAGKVEQVRTLSVIELQGSGKRVQDGVGGAAGVAAFQAGVVVDADPGQQRDLLPAQASDAPGDAPGGAGPPTRG